MVGTKEPTPAILCGKGVSEDHPDYVYESENISCKLGKDDSSESSCYINTELGVTVHTC